MWKLLSSQAFPAISPIPHQSILLDDIQVFARSSPPWSVSPWTGDGDSGISSTLIYTHAFNLGSALETTINGVAFTGNQ